MKALIRRVLANPVVNPPARFVLRTGRKLHLVSDRTARRVPVVGAVEFEWEGKRIKYLSKGDDSIASRIYWSGLGAYESATVSLWGRLLPASRVVFDVGANSGLFTLLAGADPRRDVHAFEPVPTIYACMANSVKANGFANVTPNQAAVTATDGPISLYIPDSAMMPFSASTAQGFRTAKYVVEVPGIALDSYISEKKLTDVDLVKLDTETTEHLVLAGAQQMLAEMQPAIICEVLGSGHHGEVAAALAPHGYQYYWITKQGVLPRDEIVADAAGVGDANYLFVTTSRLEKLRQSVGAGVLDGQLAPAS